MLGDFLRQGKLSRMQGIMLVSDTVTDLLVVCVFANFFTLNIQSFGDSLGSSNKSILLKDADGVIVDGGGFFSLDHFDDVYSAAATYFLRFMMT